MTDEEIEKEAKKCSQGNFYYEQGFVYGFELGLAEGRKTEADKIFDEWCSGSHDEPQECGFLKQLKNENAKLTKENAEFKKEISILLSCSNCPENKGGYVCEKEYNDKCLAQKIEYIKELKEENEELNRDKTELVNSVTELENKVNKLEKQIENYQLAENESKEIIAELKEQIEKMKCCGNCSEPCWDPPTVRKFECINNNHSLWRLAK